MRLDPVHDLQRVFRKIMAAMASPGEIGELSGEAALLDLEIPFAKGLLLVAMALLDAETSFCVLPFDPSGKKEKMISQITYARTAAPSEADFIFVTGAVGAAAADAIASAKIGSLVDPHLGATLVIEVEGLEAGGKLQLSGPGIETTAALGVGLDPSWIEARSARNSEFPLGVDLLFVDASSRLAALPRTTLVREEP